MPRVVPKPKGRRAFRKDERVRAIQAAYVEHEGESFYVHTGMELDVDHPAVRTVPAAFMPADTPSDEILLWLAEPEMPEPDPSIFNIRPPVEIPAERQVICIAGLGDFRRFIEKGQIVDVNDPFVASRPDAFSVYKPLSAEDVERLRASGT